MLHRPAKGRRSEIVNRMGKSSDIIISDQTRSRDSWEDSWDGASLWDACVCVTRVRRARGCGRGVLMSLRVRSYPAVIMS